MDAVSIHSHFSFQGLYLLPEFFSLTAVGRTGLQAANQPHQNHLTPVIVAGIVALFVILGCHSFSYYSESCFKKWIKTEGVVFRLSIGSKVKAGATIKPEEYFQYFEDLIFAPNAEIGSEGKSANHA